MSIDRLNFEGLAEAYLISLVGAGVPEGMTLEYKESLYGRSDADVKEFLKDVSSLANTTGGHVLIGVAETAGSASAIRALSGLDLDAEILRLESLMRDGLEPRITGSRIRAVPVSGGAVLAIRVPRSWNPPHRVTARNTNRFYIRNSAGAHEASVEEL